MEAKNCSRSEVIGKCVAAAMKKVTTDELVINMLTSLNN